MHVYVSSIGYGEIPISVLIFNRHFMIFIQGAILYAQGIILLMHFHVLSELKQRKYILLLLVSLQSV